MEAFEYNRGLFCCNVDGKNIQCYSLFVKYIIGGLIYEMDFDFIIVLYGAGYQYM